MGEKFSAEEVSALREDLLQGGLDSFQAGELIKVFLARLGYGCSPEAAREIAVHFEATCGDPSAFTQKLQSAALAM